MASQGISHVDPRLPPLKPYFDINGSQDESSELKEVIKKLGLQPHVEGGYFVVSIIAQAHNSLYR